jgi:hypothetical protein
MNVQVTQSELREIVELERDVTPKLKRIAELKEGVKALLIAGKTVELGRFDAFLIKFVSRSVPWKQAVMDYLGEKFAEQFKKRFQPHVRFDVKVEEHAVLPLWNGDQGHANEAGAGA